MKSRFIEIPSYYMVPDGKGHWVARDRLIFYSEKHDITIHVPAGAINNLASVPWLFRRIVPINGPSRPAAAAHDFLYEVGGKVMGKHLSRKDCDEIFLELMLSSKINYWNALPNFVKDYMSTLGFDKVFNSEEPLVNKLMAETMYAGVRVGGWASFNTKDY